MTLKPVQSNEGEAIILESARLRAQHHFNEAIALIESHIEQIQPGFRASAWFEAFHAARAKGDTEQAKKFLLAIDAADPSLFMMPKPETSH